MYQHGTDRGVPIVLIHGFFLTSGMWWQQIDDLAGDFTVYALDMVGQPGVSMQSEPMWGGGGGGGGGNQHGGTALWELLAKSRAAAERAKLARAKRAAAWVTGAAATGSSIDMLTKLFLAGFAAFAPPLRTPPLHFSGNRLLRSVHLPVQVLLAGNSVHDSSKAIRRIQSVVPRWRYRLWPNASHTLPAEIADEVNDCIRQFVIEHRNFP